jgi:CRP/FNR family transcriptional regulator, dissimilatory nitrate respiration regulator
MDRIIVAKSPDSGDISQLIRNLPLLHELSPAQNQTIAAGSKLRQVAKGQILFRKGEECRGFFIVVQGQIKLGIATPQGQEKVLELVTAGQSFGEAVMFMNRPYPVFAEALTNSSLLEVAKQTVSRMLEEDSSFGRAMLAGLARRLHMLVNDVESYSVRSATQRVIGYLLQHVDQDAPGGQVLITLPVSKHVLASRLNLTPETLSRVLRELIDDGLIDVQGKEIRISALQRLREFDL